MPNYAGLIDNNNGLLTGVAEGLRSAIGGFRDARRDVRDEETAALDRQLKSKNYALDLEKAGLAEGPDDSGQGLFHVAPSYLEKQKQQREAEWGLKQRELDATRDRDLQLKKVEHQYRMSENAGKEASDYRRAIQTKLAERNQLAEFDERGNLTGSHPLAGLMSRAGAGANAAPGGLDQEGLLYAIDSGQIPKSLVGKATDEAGKYDRMQEELRMADDVSDKLPGLATFRGRTARHLNPHAFAAGGGLLGGTLAGAGTLGMGIPAGAVAGSAAGEGVGQALKGLIAYGDEPSKQYSAVADPFIERLTKDVAGRVTPISIEKLSALLPEHNDDAETLATKKKSLHELIQSSYSFPNLKMRGFLKDGGKSTEAAGPKPGDTDSGYRFKGGNPADPKSWEKVK
jgi:hypothetical protein